jgi:hypothetical protein
MALRARLGHAVQGRHRAAGRGCCGRLGVRAPEGISVTDAPSTSPKSTTPSRASQATSERQCWGHPACSAAAPSGLCRL